ncbi:MAG: F0F1 ATP synthase subunit epsilon [Thermodesulfobacteriota bacterium]
MRLLLVTTERLLLDTEVEEVYAPGVLGEFGVLPQHVNFLTALGTGELRFRKNGVDRYVALSGGILEVLDDVVTVLADTAEFADEIDVARAKAAEERLRHALGRTAAESPEIVDLQSALSRALNRQAVATRGGTGATRAGATAIR